ncbi:extracellular solute-binding protein [Clostridium sp. MCC353]|uniref:ABC transporter substrate-binding protein n=1 Tax=Clostridium sp. MCC353 TaxID=2592646 RepID=UPI001C01DACD|nr:extracellular solute-binding protein [Clostridium sp. MCC353]MBT9777911.1 extracellular solute-binding protein [Clostridium sp. MCC353]
MKKKMALIMAGLMAVGSLTACGGAKTSETPAASQAASADAKAPADTGSQAADAGSQAAGGDAVNLTFSWWGNQTRNERTQAVLDMYTEQNPNVTFDGQFAEWADYWNKLATASAGHSLPDIVQMDYKYLEQYVSNNLLVDLTPYIESGVIDVSNVDEGILNSGKVGDGIYAICNGINAPALLYNKTLLDENGITVKDNMTKDEFIALCREINEKTGYKTNVAYNNGDNFIEYTMRANGEILFEKDKLGVASPESLEAFFDYYETGMKEGWHVDPSIFAERTIGSVEQDPLVYGTSPETMSWCALYYSNQLTAVMNAAPEGMEIGMTTWPSSDPVKSDYLKPSQFFAVTVDSKNPEEAAKVLDFVTNSVECNNVLLGERGVPISNVVADAISSQMSEGDQEVIRYINEVVTPNSSTINPPAPDGASEVYDLIDKLEERLCYGEITAKEAAQELFEQGNKIMAQ